MQSLEGLDSGILYWAVGQRRPGLNEIMRLITHLGDWNILLLVVLVLMILFFMLRSPRRAILIFTLGMGSLIFQYGIKLVVDRPRPEHIEHLVPLPNNPSFPSGHATSSLALYLGGALLLAPYFRHLYQRRLLIALGTTLGVLVGMSRPYLGVHYPFDVLAGWMIGLACIFLLVPLAEPVSLAPLDVPIA